jgi:LacI family transcriptional regulator
MSAARKVGLKDVAKAAGISVSAVSYALRGADNIPAETAARVRAIAERLGYRPNARVAELMAHIRRARPLSGAEPLAFVHLDGARDTIPGTGFARYVEIAARAHAELRGYRLDTFWLADVEGNARRLGGILSARGISGVLFAPTSRPAGIATDWPWEEFATAAVGMSELGVRPPRAAHHHFEAMREVIGRLAAGGAKRPVALMDAATNERAHRGWQAAWITYGPKAAASRVWLQSGRTADDLDGWVRKANPDAIIADGAEMLRAARRSMPMIPAERCAVLAWSPGVEVAGIDQGYDAIAAHAVDLVVTQLQRNERGLPNPPPMLLFPGRWTEPVVGKSQ